jgi:hypothetical protein
MKHYSYRKRRLVNAAARGYRDVDRIQRRCPTPSNQTEPSEMKHPSNLEKPFWQSFTEWHRDCPAKKGRDKLN